MSETIQVDRPIHAGMLINGEWTAHNDRIEVRNPARPGEMVGTIGRGTNEHVDAAVAAAKAAQPKWAKLKYSERAAILADMLKRLEAGIDDRAVLYVRENGKTLREAKGELTGVPNRQKLTLSFADQLDTDIDISDPNGRTKIRRRPFGVVVSIVPWNSPVSLAFSQIVSALLAGNSVVLKPPESCPLALIETVKLAAQGLPPGLLNLITGIPADIGERLTSHPDVGKIGFTGSIPAARKIMANASGTIKGLTLELGGNDPAVVLDDSVLADDVMQRMVTTIYRMSGQVCMAIKRIYVPTAMQSQFVDAFTKSAARIIAGDGLDPAVTMGPQHTAAGQSRGIEILDDAMQRGATVHSVGGVKDYDVFRKGYFMHPSLVTGAPDNSRLVAEEQFCPAVPVLTYDDVDEALARANDTIFGLGASVWSNDPDRGLEVGARLEAGTVWVNTHGTDHINRMAPYGGVKQSGIGRRAGLDGILEYSQSQTFTSYEPSAKS
jgi:acyl-CoA reductase-like NAD-dependent aldehyde dehydrogenase